MLAAKHLPTFRGVPVMMQNSSHVFIDIRRASIGLPWEDIILGMPHDVAPHEPEISAVFDAWVRPVMSCLMSARISVFIPCI
jgi:hypothetical protein